MVHLGNKTSSYVETAVKFMTIYPPENLDGSNDSFDPHLKDDIVSNTSEDYDYDADISFSSFGEDDTAKTYLSQASVVKMI